MKTFNEEQLINFIISETSKAYNKNLVFCRPKQIPDGALRQFIRLEEPLCCEMPWHGAKQYFKKGDYISAAPNGVYGLTAAVFHTCYEETEFNRAIAPLASIASQKPQSFLPANSGRAALRSLLFAAPQ